jgi:hypothetical protein
MERAVDGVLLRRCAVRLTTNAYVLERSDRDRGRAKWCGVKALRLKQTPTNLADSWPYPPSLDVLPSGARLPHKTIIML